MVVAARVAQEALLVLQDCHPWTRRMCVPLCQSCATGCTGMQACMGSQHAVAVWQGEQQQQQAMQHVLSHSSIRALLAWLVLHKQLGLC